MATTSTVATVKAQLVSQLDAALTVPCTYAWPGKSTAAECVFLGPHPETADIRLDLSSSIPTMKAGRKQRQEEYTVRVTVWVFRPDLTTADAATCETRAFAILADIEDVLANDTRIGLGSAVIHHMSIDSIASTLFPFQTGWACELGIDIAVEARLT